VKQNNAPNFKKKRSASSLIVCLKRPTRKANNKNDDKNRKTLEPKIDQRSAKDNLKKSNVKFLKPVVKNDENLLKNDSQNDAKI
jgi:hypothetical protein